MHEDAQRPHHQVEAVAGQQDHQHGRNLGPERQLELHRHLVEDLRDLDRGHAHGEETHVRDDVAQATDEVERQHAEIDGVGLELMPVEHEDCDH